MGFHLCEELLSPVWNSSFTLVKQQYISEVYTLTSY